MKGWHVVCTCFLMCFVNEGVRCVFNLHWATDGNGIFCIHKCFASVFKISCHDYYVVWFWRPSEVTDEEYNEFYKSFSKDSEEPMAKSHFTAEGEVTFKSILFVPKTSPLDMFQNYGKRVDHIKMYVRRVFITDNFEDMMPKYLSFVRGVVSSFLIIHITELHLARSCFVFPIEIHNHLRIVV